MVTETERREGAVRRRDDSSGKRVTSSLKNPFNFMLWANATGHVHPDAPSRWLRDGNLNRVCAFTVLPFITLCLATRLVPSTHKSTDFYSRLYPLVDCQVELFLDSVASWSVPAMPPKPLRKVSVFY